MLLTVASRAESSVFTRAILSANPAESAWMASCFDSCQRRSCRVKTASIAVKSDDSRATGRRSRSRTHACSSFRVWGGVSDGICSGHIDVLLGITGLVPEPAFGFAADLRNSYRLHGGTVLFRRATSTFVSTVVCGRA